MKVLLLFASCLLLAPTHQAQGQSSASHQVIIIVPEYATLDLQDSKSGNELEGTDFRAESIQEAGLNPLTFNEIDGVFLNFTSVTRKDGPRRKINVSLEDGSSMPSNLALHITPVALSITENGGYESQGLEEITTQKIVLKNEARSSTDILSSGLRSVYSGDGESGIQLKYALHSDGNFAATQAGEYQAIIRYTLSDF